MRRGMGRNHIVTKRAVILAAVLLALLVVSPVAAQDGCTIAVESGRIVVNGCNVVTATPTGQPTAVPTVAPTATHTPTPPTPIAIPPTSTPTAAATVTSVPPASTVVPASFSFAAGGDIGANSTTNASLTTLAGTGASFFLAIGDLSYDQVTPESAWCSYVKQRVGATYPFELLVGNHEEKTSGPDGFIDNYAACLPDRLGVTGQYGHQYYFDYPPTAPLARFILIDPDLNRGSSTANYCTSGDTANCDWLKARIDEAKAKGLWTVVGMHKVCLTMGIKSCEIGTSLLNVLIDRKVDLILQGHDHSYQRSKQLALSANCTAVKSGAYNAACVVDDGADGVYTKGVGPVTVIAANVGRDSYTISPSDAEAPYFAAWMPSTNKSYGFLKVSVSPTRLDAQFVHGDGTYSDKFAIDASATPPTLPTPTRTPTPTTIQPTPTTAPPTVTATPPTPVAATGGIWISQAEIDALPTEGAGYAEVKAAADSVSGAPSVSNQDSNHSTGIKAAALMCARTKVQAYCDKVTTALRALATGNYESGGRALAYGREMIGYVLAADIIGLPQRDPALDSLFRAKIAKWLDYPTSSGPDSLRACSDIRPNNWGTHCTASRIAIDLYLGDRADLDRAAKIVRGWMGDRNAYAGFDYGDLWWQANPSAPVGVNPQGSDIGGHDVGGLQPEEMRRAGSFTWPPKATDYAWEGNQGALASTWMLMRAGYPADQWSDRAECRVAAALYRIGWAAEGDDQWQPWLINKICGTDYPTTGGGKGKNVGWTQWQFQ